MKYINYIFFTILIYSSCTEDLDKQVDKKNLLAVDYRLFQQTEAWELARAVYKEDKNKIVELVKTEKVNINFQEPKYGRTILMLAANSGKYQMVKTLLELGADVNIRDYTDGASVIIDASGDDIPFGDNTKLIKLLLLYGANPNDLETGILRDTKHERFTPLSKACRSNKIEVAKLLIERGANVSFVSETNTFPLGEAIVQEHYELGLLLLEKGADFNPIVIKRPNGQSLRIIDLIKEKEQENLLSTWDSRHVAKIKAIVENKK